MTPIDINELRQRVSPEKLEDWFVLRYYQDNWNTVEMGEFLGISATSCQRIMKRLGVRLRTKNEVMKRLHNYTRGRKWTNEQAKKNVAIGVKRSYENEELRKVRTRDNKRVWSQMTEEEKVSRYTPGLLTMQSRKRGMKYV